jgi:cytoskeletal protein CcmA (bactofilin family)
MQTTFNAEYLIYETEGDCDPVEIIVKGYADIEALKAESVEIIRNACKTYKVAGNEVRVTLTITNSSGEYIDHDEITLSILENNEEPV